MDDLEVGYAVEVDRIDKASWHDLLTEFDDATFYQTWSYGAELWGKDNLSHVVLRHLGRVVAAAQVRIQRIPVFGSGVAFLNWGPLWRRPGGGDETGHLRNMLRALRREYVGRRRYILRILPKIFDFPENRGLSAIFADEGYRSSPDDLRTFLVDLRPSADELRQNLHKSWKGSLKFAEKQGLEIIEARTPGDFSNVAALNREMKNRKSYFSGDSATFLRINADLPPRLRLRTLLCARDGTTIAALAWSNVGKVSFPVTGGTGNQALQHKASFLLFWRMVLDSKERGFWYCDTAGVHEKRNPGGYFFKKGLAGKDAEETTYIGRFDAYKSRPLFLLFNAYVAGRERALHGAQAVRSLIKKRGPGKREAPGPGNPR